VLKNGDDTIIPDAPTKAQTARRGNRNELRDGLGQGRTTMKNHVVYPN
jgi:hypothetical protein